MEVAPFLDLAPGARAPDEVWWLAAPDKKRLRAALWRAEAARGHVVLLSGRTEFLEKMAVPAAAFRARGFDVVSLDWRGQGLSDRLVAPRLKGHIGDYRDFQTDLDALLADPRVAALTGPRVLAAHSMGGAVATAALARPEVAGTLSCAILSAPMLGIRMTLFERVVAWLATKIGMALGLGHCWPPIGDVDTPYVLAEKKPDENVLTGDETMWAWLVATARNHSDLSIATPTLSWLDASSREVRRLSDLGAAPCPVLVLLGSAEKVVDPKAVRAGARRLGANLVPITGARHEIFIEKPGLRDEAWTAIDAFLAETLD